MELVDLNPVASVVDSVSSATVNTPARKLRVLLLSALIPIERSGGGCLAMRRHFILRDDFELTVATVRNECPEDVPHFQIRRNLPLRVLRRCGAHRLANNLEYLFNWWGLPAGLIPFARDFQPDVIFTVADDFHMGLAWQLSRQLKIPLAVNFQDLFAVSLFSEQKARPYPGVRQFLLNCYRFLNSRADVVFHTSEGMRAWFTPECRGDVLYPVPDTTGSIIPHEVQPSPRGAIKLVYTGNASGAYGRMLLRLARVVQNNPRIDFRIFTSAPDWSAQEQRQLEQAGIYRGFLPFEQLRLELAEADAFLSVMSFEPEQFTFMTTSFTTKCGDYVPWARPMFIWGPAYCSACLFVKKYAAGIAIETDDPAAVVQRIIEISQDEAAWQRLCEGALAAATGPLNPEQIHQVLKSGLIACRNEDSLT